MNPSRIATRYLIGKRTPYSLDPEEGGFYRVVKDGASLGRTSLQVGDVIKFVEWSGSAYDGMSQYWEAWGGPAKGGFYPTSGGDDGAGRLSYPDGRYLEKLAQAPTREVRLFETPHWKQHGDGWFVKVLDTSFSISPEEAAPPLNVPVPQYGATDTWPGYEAGWTVHMNESTRSGLEVRRILAYGHRGHNPYRCVGGTPTHLQDLSPG